ncbi:MAG: DUF58 domain-containing protein [Clostridia bacterium]|nr:DUF58 domain-containing protein [Deltaproteobacteria bacterium]
MTSSYELSPQLLSDIETLQVAARNIVAGALAGAHRSNRRGSSIEFSEHKLYTPGDEIRHIDWRAYAKTDRYHVKQFEDETNISLELLIDSSASMAFAAEDRKPKLEYARTLGAALCYLALRQGDASGLVTFGTTVRDELPSRATSAHMLEVMTRLARLAPVGETSLVRALDQFAQRNRRRSLVVVITDMFDPDPNLLDAFRRLAARRHDVALLHLLDPVEIDFPYENPATFASMEDDRKIFVHPRTLRQQYVKEMHAFLERTSRALRESGVDYREVRTSESPATVLGEFLRGRELA